MAVGLIAVGIIMVLGFFYVVMQEEWGPEWLRWILLVALVVSILGWVGWSVAVRVDATNSWNKFYENQKVCFDKGLAVVYVEGRAPACARVSS